MNASKQYLFGIVVFGGLLLSTFLSGFTPISLENNSDENPYLGRWALHLPNGAGWLEVRDEGEYLDADIMWYGGSVVPVNHIYTHEGKLFLNQLAWRSAQRENGRKHRPVYQMVLEGSGDELIGKMVQPDPNGKGAKTTVFLATRIPDLPKAPNLSSLKYGKEIKLLANGTEGWRLVDPAHSNGWSVEKGVLTNKPVQHEGQEHIHYGNLRTDQTFEDFRLQLKVNVPAGNNSGIYLKGIYEIQVFDSYGKKKDSHHMGALYSRITPSESAERKPGKWQDFDITLCDRHLTVILNGTKIIDNQAIMGVTGGALTADEFVPGPIYLQGDHGEVSYKDIILTPILK